MNWPFYTNGVDNRISSDTLESESSDKKKPITKEGENNGPAEGEKSKGPKPIRSIIPATVGTRKLNANESYIMA